MEAKIYKKSYLDTNNDLINRLKLLLEDGIDDEIYYKRFNDIYELKIDYESFIKFLNAKSIDIKSYARSYSFNHVNMSIDSFLYDTEDFHDVEDLLIFHEFYNNYKIAYYNDEDIENDKIYRTSELSSLVRKGKIVLLGSYEREEVMNDDLFMDEVSDLQAFSSYPFDNFNLLDEKTRELTMRIIHTLVPIERIHSDINMLGSKVKKLEHK